jgi:hypothetical protein
VSDERSRRARLEIPAADPASRGEVTTDRVRLQQPLPDLAPDDPARLLVVVNPMSLTVLTAPAP